MFSNIISKLSSDLIHIGVDLDMKTLNPKFKDVLDNCYDEFISVVPTDEILSDLKFEKILSDWQAETIENCIHKEEKTYAIFDTLRNHRSLNDLFKFCEILQKEKYAKTVQKFGKCLHCKIRDVKIA